MSNKSSELPVAVICTPGNICTLLVEDIATLTLQAGAGGLALAQQVH